MQECSLYSEPVLPGSWDPTQSCLQQLCASAVSPAVDVSMLGTV